MKNILVLGAGRVARPLIRYLLSHSEYQLVVATDDPQLARTHVGEHFRAQIVRLDVRDSEATGRLIAEADIVVGLLPAPLNPGIARLAIEHRTPLVNTSYVAPEMAKLDREARDAGVLVLNEIGLDPGIDHMSAVDIIDRVSELGGTISGFLSSCGGFPAREANTNPWGYKFSWSPRAVMVAGTQPARYLRQGEIVEIPGPELFHHCWPDEIEGLGAFEIYPNRDALRYVELYGLDGIRNMIRCTCRYPGWVETMKAAVDLGLLSLEERSWPAGTTYAEVTSRLLEPGDACLAQRIADRLGISVDSKIIARLEWAGLLSDRPIPETSCAPLDVLGNRLEHLMRYQAGERDAVVLKHVFWVDLSDGSREEIRSTLVQTGEPWGDSAMARTVALPAAIATRLILSGAVTATGVQIPILKEIYQPVLAELAQRGISFSEQHFRTFAGPFEV